MWNRLSWGRELLFLHHFTKQGNAGWWNAMNEVSWVDIDADSGLSRPLQSCLNLECNEKTFFKGFEKPQCKLDENLKGTVGSLLWKLSSWGAMRTYANWLTCGDRHRWRTVHLWRRCLSTVYLFILHNEMKTRVMTDQSPSTYWFICLSIRCNISEDEDNVRSKKKKKVWALKSVFLKMKQLKC